MFQDQSYRRGVAAFTAAVMAFAAVSPAVAKETPLQASYPTDGQLTCDQLLVEVAKMEEILGIAQGSARSADGQAMAANIGTSVAINGALYSGALGAVPGVGLFANGAGMFARRSAEAKKKAAEERMRTAETRRAILSGLYQGKNCGQPAAPVAAVASATDTPAPAGSVAAAMAAPPPAAN